MILKSGNRVYRTASIIALIFSAAPQFAQEAVKRAEAPPPGPCRQALTTIRPLRQSACFIHRMETG